MSPENTIMDMDKQIPDFESIVEFDIQYDQLRKIRQAASALGVDHLTIFGRGNDILVRVHQLSTEVSNPTDDCFEFVVGSVTGGTADGSKFVFNISSLPTYEGDYNVRLSSNIFSKFTNKNVDISYWVAMRDETKVV
jgi:hypothetical protein